MLPNVWLLVLLLGIVGCTETGKLTGNPVEPAVASTPVSSTRVKQTKTLKLKLTLDSPSDLLVQEGDQVTQSQLIVDRKSARAALEAQRQVLNLKLQALEERAKPKFESPVIEPEPSYRVELAKIDAARSEVQGLEDQIRGFEQGSGYTPVAWRDLPMQEQRDQLLALRQQLAKARADLKLATAEFNQAQDDYRRRVKVAQAKARIPIKETINPVERLQVLQELKLLEGQILTTGRVMAPQSGQVKKIKWVGMQDQSLQVEVSLAVQGGDHETSASR